MDTVIIFLRDTLSGTAYFIVSIICVILICICVWQLVQHNKKVKKTEEEFVASHVVLINDKGEEEIVEISSPTINISQTSSIYNVQTIPVVNNTASDLPEVKELTTSAKPVVMINPAEVAAISSTMNVIGSSSVKNVNSKENINNDTTNVVNTSQVVGNDASVNKASGNGQNFTN